VRLEYSRAAAWMSNAYDFGGNDGSFCAYNRERHDAAMSCCTRLPYACNVLLLPDSLCRRPKAKESEI
jgi:hypothetical protein